MSEKPETRPLANYRHCGAKSKRTGHPCKGKAMANGRCRMHGGKSTGARTPEGLERSRTASLKHGYYTKEAKAARKLLRQIMKFADL